MPRLDNAGVVNPGDQLVFLEADIKAGGEGGRRFDAACTDSVAGLQLVIQFHLVSRSFDFQLDADSVHLEGSIFSGLLHATIEQVIVVRAVGWLIVARPSLAAAHVVARIRVLRSIDGRCVGVLQQIAVGAFGRQGFKIGLLGAVGGHGLIQHGGQQQATHAVAGAGGHGIPCGCLTGLFFFGFGLGFFLRLGCSCGLFLGFGFSLCSLFCVCLGFGVGFFLGLGGSCSFSLLAGGFFTSSLGQGFFRSSTLGGGLLECGLCLRSTLVGGLGFGTLGIGFLSRSLGCLQGSGGLVGGAPGCVGLSGGLCGSLFGRTLSSGIGCGGRSSIRRCCVSGRRGRRRRAGRDGLGCFAAAASTAATCQEKQHGCTDLKSVVCRRHDLPRWAALRSTGGDQGLFIMRKRRV